MITVSEAVEETIDGVLYDCICPVCHEPVSLYQPHPYCYLLPPRQHVADQTDRLIGAIERLIAAIERLEKMQR